MERRELQITELILDYNQYCGHSLLVYLLNFKTIIIMTKVNIVKVSIVSITLLFLNSCADMLDDIRPKDRITQDQLNETDLEKVLNGVYAAMEKFAFDYYLDGDVKGENFEAGPGFGLIDPMQMTPIDGQILNLWQSSFSTLKQINFLVETYEASNNQGNEVLKKVGGTAYYFRALVYYNMVIRWGGVPILRERTNDIVPVSPENEVWNFILENLKQAEQLLPVFTNKYYVSQSANDALFAKVYLSLDNKADAATYAQKVIDKSNSFTLAATSKEYAESFVYNTTSKELVFALANARTTDLLRLYTSTNDVDATWEYAPAADCYANLYVDKTEKTGDIRAQAVFGSENTRTLKFANGLSGQFIENEKPTQSPIVVSRIAEMHLIKAEALRNTTEGKQALKTFMEKRYSTVNMPSTSTDVEYQNMILDERHREFFGEGFRWYDLKRTKRLDLFKSLNGRNYLMSFPIPQNEIDLAGKENYPQNDGY
jgi:hypothetical protein